MLCVIRVINYPDLDQVKYDKQYHQGKAGGVQLTQPPPDPVTRASGKEPRRTPNKNREGHTAEYGQANGE
jgi:hypothetical protein